MLIFGLSLISLIPLCKALQTSTFTSGNLFTNNKRFKLSKLKLTTTAPFDDKKSFFAMNAIKNCLVDDNDDEEDLYDDDDYEFPINYYYNQPLVTKKHYDEVLGYKAVGIRKEMEAFGADEKMTLYRRLIHEFITGVPYCASVDEITPLIQLHRKFYRFLSSGASDRIVWPLCYIEYIIADMRVDKASRKAYRALAALLKRLTIQANTRQNGKGWELMLQVGILINCIGASLHSDLEYPLSRPPLSLVPSGARAKVRFIELPLDIATLDGTWSYLSEQLEACREPTIVLVEPAPLDFPLYDMFLVYTPGTADGQALDVTSVRVAGIQAKPRPLDMDQPVPAFVNSGSYLAHCHTVKRVRGTSTLPCWVDLSEEQVEGLLGFSLKVVASIDWTAA